MSAIRSVHYRTLVKVFEQEGFVFSRQTGDHLIYTKAGVKRPLVIPMYQQVPVFIIKNVIRTAGMSRNVISISLQIVSLRILESSPSHALRARLRYSRSDSAGSSTQSV